MFDKQNKIGYSHSKMGSKKMTSDYDNISNMMSKKYKT